MLFRILHYDVLDSTNNLAKELASLGALEGTVVVTDYQTKGRGQFNRRWHSPQGKDLLFSIVLRPLSIKAGNMSLVTQVAAKSIQNVLSKKFGIKSKIKKPNDVLIDDKKVCGILVEGSSFSSRMDSLVIGVGLNINSGKSELLPRATSISTVSGVKQDRKKTLELLLEEFRNCYYAFFPQEKRRLLEQAK